MKQSQTHLGGSSSVQNSNVKCAKKPMETKKDVDKSYIIKELYSQNYDAYYMSESQYFSQIFMPRNSRACKLNAKENILTQPKKIKKPDASSKNKRKEKQIAKLSERELRAQKRQI